MKKLNFLTITLISFLLLIQNLKSENFTTIYFYINEPISCKKNIMNSLLPEIIFNLNQIKYFRVLFYNKDIKIKNSIPLTFLIKNCKSQYNFTFILSSPEFQKKFIIKNKSDFKKLPISISNLLKEKFPLKGIIISKKNNEVTLNIGANYDIKKDEKFITFNNKGVITGNIIITKVYETYSKGIITIGNQNINTNNVIIKFSYDILKKFKKQNICKRSSTTRVILKSKSKFKVKSNKDYILAANMNEFGIISLNNFIFNKLFSIGYNSIKDIKLSYNNSYAGLKNINNNLYIIDILNNKKYLLMLNSYQNKYKIINLNETNLYNFIKVKISSFNFYYNKLIFFDKKLKNLIVYNIGNNLYKKIEIENINFINKTKNLYITKNGEILIINFLNYNNKNSILIKNLKNQDEIIIQNIKNYLLNSLETEIIYLNNQNELHIYSIYNKNSYIIDKNLSINNPVLKLSISEEYLMFYEQKNPDKLFLYDFKNQKLKIDIFRKNKVKYIKRIEFLPDDSILIFGRLNDIDKNKKIDYRDPESLIRYNFLKDTTYKITEKIDNFLDYSMINTFILYSYNKKLYFKGCQK